MKMNKYLYILQIYILIYLTMRFLMVTRWCSWWNLSPPISPREISWSPCDAHGEICHCCTFMGASLFHLRYCKVFVIVLLIDVLVQTSKYWNTYFKLVKSRRICVSWFVDPLPLTPTCWYLIHKSSALIQSWMKIEVWWKTGKKN